MYIYYVKFVVVESINVAIDELVSCKQNLGMFKNMYINIGYIGIWKI